MKATAAQQTPQPPIFIPVTLTMTLESKEELDAFYTLFNTLSVADVLRAYGVAPEIVRAALVPHDARHLSHMAVALIRNEK